MRFGVGQQDRFAASGRTEAFELLKAWLGTTFAFAIILSRQDFTYVEAGIIAALTAGIGFVLHELGHRVVARAFGAEARFWANDGMLVLSILGAFAGFLFAAPGAVWHSGFLTRRQSGLVSAAGPIVNMVLAVVFLLASFLALRAHASPLLVVGLRAGFQINAWLGFFNMLPIGPIDGAKVLNWSVPAFVTLIAVGAGLAFGYDRIAPFIAHWLLGR
ncbi:MAG: peptidase M50 [Herpetosiphon sp.]